MLYIFPQKKYWLDTAQQPPSGFDLDKVEA